MALAIVPSTGLANESVRPLSRTVGETIACSLRAVEKSRF